MYKPDYEPLLCAGRHEMTAGQFRKCFVDGLGGSNRPAIWKQFKDKILTEIEALDIKCELWIDGSFITKCPEPDDIDGSLMIVAEQIDILSQEALTYLDNFDDGASPFHNSLDIYLCQVYPKGHHMRGDMNDPDGWAKQWSGERNSNWLKGFVVIPFR